MKDLNVYKKEIFRRGEERLKKRKAVRRRVLFVCLPLLLCGVIVGSVLLHPYLTDRGVVTTPASDPWATARLVTICSAKDGLTPGEIVNLMAGVQGTTRTATVDLTAGHAAAADFAVRLLQASLREGNNTLIAPLSALMALGMTANGAAGETRAQMAATLGMSIEEWNDYMAAARALFASTDDVTFETCNSLWIDGREDFAVDADFLQTNADCYDADAFWIPAGQSMADAVNAWVAEKTNGRITRIAEEPDGSTWISLVNALYFETDWETEWLSVDEGDFYRLDGIAVKVDMMRSEETVALRNETGTIAGFAKYYCGGEYAFAALKPGWSFMEGATNYRNVKELLAALTGEELAAIWQNRYETAEPFEVCMPKFSIACDLSLKEALCAMGMPIAFDGENADFSGIGRFGEHDTHEISEVRQKTALAADVNGTVGSAATQVDVFDDPDHNIILNCPFFYMIVHVESGVPIFMGIMLDPTA